MPLIYRFCFGVIRTFDLSFQRARATSARHKGAKAFASRGFTNGSIMKIISDGTMKTQVYMGSPQIVYQLGQYSVVVEITGRNAGKIVTVMGDYNVIGSGGIRGMFTGF